MPVGCKGTCLSYSVADSQPAAEDAGCYGRGRFINALCLPREAMPSVPTPRFHMFLGALSLEAPAGYRWVGFTTNIDVGSSGICMYMGSCRCTGVVSCSYSISICRALGSDFLYIMYLMKQHLAQDYTGKRTSRGFITA